MGNQMTSSRTGQGSAARTASRKTMKIFSGARPGVQHPQLLILPQPCSYHPSEHRRTEEGDTKQIDSFCSLLFTPYTCISTKATPKYFMLLDSFVLLPLSHSKVCEHCFWTWGISSSPRLWDSVRYSGCNPVHHARSSLLNSHYFLCSKV